MTNSTDPWRDGEPDDVTTMLNDLPEVDPPSTLTADVMSTIASRTPVHETRSPIFMRRSKNMAKKVLWIVAATAAAALIAMKLVGYPPVEKGTEATIGAAQRYQAPQISNADVKVGDQQLQAFLQSDVFHQLAADKTAQQALKNKDFQRALADASIRAALAAPDLRAAIADAARNATAARLDVRAAAPNAKIDVALQSRLEAVLQSSAALRVALASPEVAQALASTSLNAALAQPNIALALSQDAAVKAVLGAAGSSIDAAAVSPNAAPNAAKDAVGNAVR